MFPHARTRAGVIVGFAAVVSLTATGCLYPPVNPYGPWPAHPSAYPSAYPLAAATPPKPQPAAPADKSVAPVPDNRSAGVEPVQHQQPATPPAPVVAAPSGPTTPASRPPGSIPLPYPQPLAADPHTRTTPTASGAALGLGPNELPLDRAVELSRRIDGFAFENQRLADRIKTLEAKADEREHAINESVRNRDAAVLEEARTKVEMKVVRREIEALQERVKTIEKEDVEMLRKVIDALEKLLQSGE